MCKKKVVSFEEFTKIRAGLEGKKVVHCHGVYDLLHIGHIKHFEQARSSGMCW